MSKLNRKFLDSILSQPTAPYREMHVQRIITQELDNNNVPWFKDPIGNILVGASSKKEYLKIISKKGKEPVRLFIAHADHPGFHGVKWIGPKQLSVQWHGGSPPKLLDGAEVWLADAKGLLGKGKFTQIQMSASGTYLDKAVVEISTQAKAAGDLTKKKPTEIFGAFQFRETHWQEGDLIYTKAADDLIGVYCICALAIENQKSKIKKSKKVPFLGLISRAEEVGFIGTIGHFELGWLKRAKAKLLCVSLETSRTLPGADIGKGPVLRLGDRFTVFSAAELRLFTDLAEANMPGRYQRRIMDGGTCEGTAAIAYGIPTVAISVPLGNYHNQSFQGGPDSRGPDGPAPEFVHVGDTEGLLDLCRLLLIPGNGWSKPFETKRKAFKESLKKAEALL